MARLSKGAAQGRAPARGQDDFESDVGHLFVRGAVAAREQRRAHGVALAERRTRTVLVVVSAAPAQLMSGRAQVLCEQPVTTAARATFGAAKEEAHAAAFPLPWAVAAGCCSILSRATPEGLWHAEKLSTSITETACLSWWTATGNLRSSS